MSDFERSMLLEMKKIGIEKLPYSYSSLERFIDQKTMDIHYNKHYKSYVKKLNKALSEKDYGDVELEDIIKSISRYNTTIRNNAGGAFNHALFWKMLSPKKQTLKGELLKKINKEFGGYQQFKKKFEELAKKTFGSGWIWLTLTTQNRLKIVTTPNQDNPLMNIVKGGGFPILGLDLWEHAYYLKYRNDRDEYISKFWECVNWEFVETLYQSKQKKKSVNESYMNKKIISEECSKEEIQIYKTIFNINNRIKWDFNNTINKVQKELFPDNWYEKDEYQKGDLPGLYDFRGEQGRSVLNYMNTHYVCYCILLNDMNKVLEHSGQEKIKIVGETPKKQIEENKRFLSLIEKYGSRIFSENSKTLQKMYPYLEKSANYGKKGEEYVESKFQKKFGENSFKIIGKLGSAEDAEKGVDCEALIDGQFKKGQIKPYQKFLLQNGVYSFFETGAVKKYYTDLMIFQKINNTVFIFDNKDVKIVDGVYHVPESSLITKI